MPGRARRPKQNNLHQCMQRNSGPRLVEVASTNTHTHTHTHTRKHTQTHANTFKHKQTHANTRKHTQTHATRKSINFLHDSHCFKRRHQELSCPGRRYPANRSPDTEKGPSVAMRKLEQPQIHHEKHRSLSSCFCGRFLWLPPQILLWVCVVQEVLNDRHGNDVANVLRPWRR